MTFPTPAMFGDWQTWARALMVEQEHIAAGAGGAALPPVGYEPVWRETATEELVSGNISGTEPSAEDVLKVKTLNIATTNISNVGYTEFTSGGTLAPYTQDVWEAFDTAVSGGTVGSGGGTGGSTGGGGSEQYDMDEGGG